MKSFMLCAALALYSFSATAALAADEPGPEVPARGRGVSKKPTTSGDAGSKKAGKLSPATEAVAPNAPDAAPVPLEALPPPPATPAPAPAAPPPAAPDRAESSTTSSSSTRLEAIVGRTQSLGFAAGVRAGHRMTNNVYLGGTVMVQTGITGGFLTYPGFELGYDAKLGDARFMPYLGVGPMIAIPTEGDAKPEVSPVVYPGFAFRFESEKSPLIAGADVRFLYLTETDSAAVALNLTTGLRF